MKQNNYINEIRHSEDLHVRHSGSWWYMRNQTLTNKNSRNVTQMWFNVFPLSPNTTMNPEEGRVLPEQRWCRVDAPTEEFHNSMHQPEKNILFHEDSKALEQFHKRHRFQLNAIKHKSAPFDRFHVPKMWTRASNHQQPTNNHQSQANCSQWFCAFSQIYCFISRLSVWAGDGNVSAQEDWEKSLHDLKKKKSLKNISD